jgi:F-type H+-transporting ATPase subunit epsilon
MSKKLNLKIITPNKVLVDEQVNAVFSKNVDGEFGILPGHISYMTALGIGVSEFRKDTGSEYVSVIGGMLQVTDNNVIILTDKAELGQEIDIARANAAKERAEARLREVKPETDIDRAQIALARAVARIQAASKKR